MCLYIRVTIYIKNEGKQEQKKIEHKFIEIVQLFFYGVQLLIFQLFRNNS